MTFKFFKLLFSHESKILKLKKAILRLNLRSFLVRDINGLHFALQQSHNTPLWSPEAPGKTGFIGEKQALLAGCKGCP